MNLSQRMLAGIAGLSPSTIHHAEVGAHDPSMSTVDRPAEVLGTSAARIISGNEASR
jgi:predicted transcriptional regulator